MCDIRRQLYTDAINTADSKQYVRSDAYCAQMLSTEDGNYVISDVFYCYLY